MQFKDLPECAQHAACNLLGGIYDDKTDKTVIAKEIRDAFIALYSEGNCPQAHKSLDTAVADTGGIFGKKYTEHGESAGSRIIKTDYKPKIYRGSMSDCEIIRWMEVVIRDLKRVSAQEKDILALAQDTKDASKRLNSTRSSLSEAFCQQVQDPILHHEKCDTVRQG